MISASIPCIFQASMKDVFDEAILAGLSRPDPKPNNKPFCSIIWFWYPVGSPSYHSLSIEVLKYLLCLPRKKGFSTLPLQLGFCLIKVTFLYLKYVLYDFLLFSGEFKCIWPIDCTITIHDASKTYNQMTYLSPVFKFLLKRQCSI